jgi:hypothetical protein
MARGNVPTGSKNITVTRANRNGVSGTLVKTTTSRSGSSSPKKTYAQLAKEGGNVAAAKAYNAKKTSESFRPDAPAKMTPKKASISSPTTTRSIKGTPMKVPRPRISNEDGSYGGITSSKNKGKLKKTVKKTFARANDRMGAAKKRKPMQTSKGKLGCGVNSKRCKAPKRR